MEWRANAYHDQLSGDTGQTCIDYLASRGFDGWELEPFRLGYVVDPLPGDELYRGMLAIPYLTPSGVMGIKYRCILDHNCKQNGHAKYSQPSGQKQRIYNVQAYFSGRPYVGVSEGEFDAICATVKLDIPTMGIPGGTQWKASRQFWSLVLRDFDKVIIFADGDDTGKAFARQVAEDAPYGSVIVSCDDGEDVNSMVLAGKGGELRRKAGFK